MGGEMKLIKFDLSIDGVKVKDINELRDHFTPEILAHYRSGVLAKWLMTRKYQDELEAIKALDGAEDHVLLKRLCEIFGVEADDLVIAEILKKTPAKSSENLAEKVQYYYNQLADLIDSAIYEAVRRNCIVKVEMCSSPEFHEKELFYKSERFYDVPGAEAKKSVQVAPSVGKIVEKYKADDRARSYGDIIGWFQMSAHAEDYCSSWHNFVSVLEQRRKILADMAKEVQIPLLKKALEKRVMQLQEVIDILKEDEKDLNATDNLSDKEKAYRKKRNQSKIDLIKNLSEEKRTIISRKRKGLISISLSCVVPGGMFLSDSKDYKEGDLVYANDSIDCSRSDSDVFPVTGTISCIKKAKETPVGSRRKILEKNVDIEIDISN